MYAIICVIKDKKNIRIGINFINIMHPWKDPEEANNLGQCWKEERGTRTNFELCEYNIYYKDTFIVQKLG